MAKKKKEGKEGKDKKIGFQKTIVSKTLVKPSQLTIVIKKQEPHSILGEENKFFKDIMEQEKRGMFFS